MELNGGIAFLDDFKFPGASFLYGATIRTKSNMIFEFSGGVAFPTVVTGKIGIGLYAENTKFVVGIRPFPFNLYLQIDFPRTYKGNWIISFEVNPLDENDSLSFYSRGNINVGYRWDKTKNKSVNDKF